MFVGLDLGTTKIKALLVEPDGHVVARASAGVELFHVGDGGVEQNMEDIWTATLSALGQLSSRAEVSGVRAVGVSAQGGALQICDADYRPVGRVISWLDGRCEPYKAQLTRELGPDWFARRIGHGASGYVGAQLLRLREVSPGLLDPPHRIGFVGDVITGRLCGRAAHDATSLSIATLFNPWLRTADPEFLDRLRIAEGRLPDLLAPSATAGGLRHEVAEKTRLPAGIPVSPAVHDQYAAALGAGALHAGDVMFGAGTAWVLLAAVDRLTEPVIDNAFVCTHLAEGMYGQMLSLANGGSSFSWAKDLLGLDRRTVGDMDVMLDSVSPGSDGMRFWPLLVPQGAAGLARGTAGRLSGLRLSHKAAHIMRAVVEGLALELARYLRFFMDRGLAVKRLVMTGGAAGSSVTPQIVSDVSGLPLTCTAESEMSALGAAVIARALVEESADLVSLSEEMAAGVRVCEPGRNAVLYREMFHEYVRSLPLACSERAH